MLLDTFFIHYLNIKGTANRTQFLTAISIFLMGRIFISFYYSIKSIDIIINSFLPQSQYDVDMSPQDGLLGFDEPISIFRGSHEFILDDIISFITIYILFVVTVKYCRSLKFSEKKSYGTSLLLSILFSLAFISIWSNSFFEDIPILMDYLFFNRVLFLPVLLLPLLFAVYLFRKESTQKLSVIEKMYIYSSIMPVLIFFSYYIAPFHFKFISAVYLLITIIAIVYYLFCIKPVVLKLAPHWFHAWLVLTITLIINIGITFVGDNFEWVTILDTIVLLLDALVCLYFLSLSFIAATDVVLDIDKEQAGEPHSGLNINIIEEGK